MKIQKSADLARIVKTRRQAQGLTQQNIADAVGITRQSVARIELGHGGVSFDTVLRIFETLGIQLQTTVNSQHHDGPPAPSVDQPQETSSASLAAARFPEVPTYIEDAVAAARHLDVSALTAAAAAEARFPEVPSYIEDAVAAARNFDASALLPRWEAALNDLTGQLRATAALAGTELNESVARQAILSAAIEAGDPDREDPLAGGRSLSRNASEESRDD